MHTCAYCLGLYEPTRSDRRFCSTNCRVQSNRAEKARKAKNRDVAVALLMRQTCAIIAGADRATLDAIAREAELAFPL